MNMARNAPGEIELCSNYSVHLGPRFEAAGLRIQFHYNQIPGVHFKVQPPQEYKDAILRGIQDGMALRFPDFPKTGSIWITEIILHPVDSCERAFYRASRMAIDQAYSFVENGSR